MTGLCFSIGQLAREFGLTTRTLRFYEGKGLLSPKRIGNDALVRLYTERDRTNLMTIIEAKRLGFELDDIKTALMQPDGRIVIPLALLRQQRDALDAKRTEIDSAINRLNAIEVELHAA